jgi:hypothetical protein
MPRFYEAQGEELEEAAASKLEPAIPCRPLFFALVFLYYVVSCGIERIYQPMAFTFGLCGPLDLSPPAAASTDSFYNGGFMCGRIGKEMCCGCHKCWHKKGTKNFGEMTQLQLHLSFLL